MPSDVRGDDYLQVAEDVRLSLAAIADQAAELFESLAEFHDRVVAIEGHPLAGIAVQRADEERRFARRERETGIRLRAIAGQP